MIAGALAASQAHAKLPPPTPEEAAAKQAQKAKEEARLKHQKELLEKAQDRVAERYRRESRAAHAGASSGGRVTDTNMPNNVRELPGKAPPQGGHEQSAEAHSAPAR